MVAWIQWMDYFRNILPDNSQGIFFVLRDSCDGEFTFEIRGNETIFIGRGDFHDKTFNNMKKNATFKNVKDLGDGTKRGIPLNRDQCNIDIDVYPSKRFYGLYNTTTPIIMTVAVAAIFVFTALMFVFYDRLVERRQAVVMEKAAQSNAVVKSLFPENVRERLLEQAADNGKNDKVKDKDSGFLAPNSRLKGYLNGAEEDNINEAPIADLFPHCTGKYRKLIQFMTRSQMAANSRHVFLYPKSSLLILLALLHGAQLVSLRKFLSCYRQSTRPLTRLPSDAKCSKLKPSVIATLL